jgi:hypothetical protein
VLLFNTITISSGLPTKMNIKLNFVKTYSFDLGRPTMAARLNSQHNDDNDRLVRRRQNKVLSTKVPVDLHDRFNLLAEYLFERGLSEDFTSSALLRDIIEQLLVEYHEGLIVYERSQLSE